MTQHLIKISAINLYFHNNNSLLVRGENSYESNNVKSVQFEATLLMIRGVVASSMKSKSYKVEISLTNEFEIESGHCECPRGQEICHHIAALLLAARNEISKTDVSCSWLPKPNNSEEVKTLRQVYNIKKHPRVTDRDLTEEEVMELYDKLRTVPPVGFRWILSNDPGNQTGGLDLPDIKSIIMSTEYTGSSNPIQYLKDILKLTSEVINKVVEKTVAQKDNPDWYIARRCRITASNFNRVLMSTERNRFPPSLFSTLRDQKDLSRVKAIQWGNDHEKEGIQVLSRMLKKEIKGCGVFLSESGVLGASPDGLIDEDIVVEIKCPYKYRKVLLTEALKGDKSYIFYYDDKSVLRLNLRHPYYDQVQRQLWLTGREYCYLCVWTPKQAIYCLIIFNILRSNLRLCDIFLFEILFSLYIFWRVSAMILRI